ncbi:MAG: hypothetical protein JW928_05355, partial [Candidatus Aureabacteria bacterium]|nr:hypothetical protein [Candidatus Auribacterota bacterium]
MESQPKTTFLRDLLVIIFIFALLLALIVGGTVLIFKNFVKTHKEPLVETVKPSSEEPGFLEEGIPQAPLAAPESPSEEIKKMQMEKEPSPEEEEAPSTEEQEASLPEEAIQSPMEPAPLPATEKDVDETAPQPVEDVFTPTEEIDIPSSPDDVRAPDRSMPDVPEESSGQKTKKDFMEAVSDLGASPSDTAQPPAAPVQEQQDKITIIHLKNGHQLEGRIIQQKDDLTVLEYEGATVEIRQEEIDNIEHITLKEYEKRLDISREIIAPEFVSGQEVIVVTYD